MPTQTPPADSWSIPALREPRYSQSLERGLAILGCFTPTRPVLGIADIADELGMSRSTTHRYVITLVALGYLEQGASRKYRLGLRVTDLGMSALNSTSLHDHAHPYLLELGQRAQFAISLSVLDGSEIVYVDRVHAYRRPQEGSSLEIHAGSRLPAYCTAMGKLLLAYQPAEQRKESIALIQPAKQASLTITSKTGLNEALEEILAFGMGTAESELQEGLCAIAAPVRDETRNVVAAAGISAPAQVVSLEQLVDGLGPHLVATADRISARLGYRRDDEIARAA